MSSSASALVAERPSPYLPWWRFNLAELMACVTMLAVCLSLWSIHPALSVMALLLFIPALLRALAAKRWAKTNGMTFSVGRQIVEFAYSVAFAFVGCILFEVTFVALALPTLVLCLMFKPLFRLLADGVWTAMLWLWWCGVALLYGYVQWRFLRYTLRLKALL